MADKQKSGIEIIENEAVLNAKVDKAKNFVEANNKLFMYIGGAILAILLGYYAFKYWSNTKEKEASAAMSDAVFSFESDSLNQALKGKGGNLGLLEIGDTYGSTKAGKLANLYAGIAYMRQNKFKEAIERLDKFNADDEVLQAKAYCLIGDSNMELKNTAEAIKFYEKAAQYEPNKFATPGYLMKLATAYTEAKNQKDALGVYTDLVNKYPLSPEGQQAKKYQARLQAELGQ